MPKQGPGIRGECSIETVHDPRHGLGTMEAVKLNSLPAVRLRAHMVKLTMPEGQTEATVWLDELIGAAEAIKKALEP